MYLEDFEIDSVGSFWDKADLPENLVRTVKHTEAVSELTKALMRTEPAKPILIAGETGVGKSTLIHLVAEKLHLARWQTVKLAASDLIAGQRYVGDIEQNVKKVAEWFKQNEQSLWLAPRFQEFLFMGSYDSKPAGVLEQLTPYLEKRLIHLVAEIDSRYLEKLMQARPRLRDIFEVITVEASSQDFTMQLASDWIANDSHPWLWQDREAAFVQEAYSLAHQYLPHGQNPGIVLNLLKATKQRVKVSDQQTRITTQTIIEALSKSTGMPRVILDDQEPLDVNELKEHFARKVVGQQEAVRQITERIAMIKAGLVDPSKPSGVFLFVGPTGTGKTEIAKTLAAYLFGSEERMIRLDMSEFQTADSMYRLLGDGQDMSDQFALVNHIRKKPFSVILLDEFEKAHQNIWDLFLQVFDDGRLTDQQGKIADFRHAIIIMTSNVGSSLPTSQAVGFKPASNQYSEEQVLKSLQGTFRPEFLNRIDRIVAFNPLTKSVVRKILRAELRKVLKRRGLRQKRWSIEWEDSAIDFLMEKGYSATLGARPMKRAIEQYLLAPLALTIVQHQYPRGDQFLFISRKGNALYADFIDPDEPEVSWEVRKQKISKAEKLKEQLTLNQIILSPQGNLAEFKKLDQLWEALETAVAECGMEEDREELMQTLAEPGFWERADRFPFLTDLEMIDRFREAMDSARSWRDRLQPDEKERLSYPSELIGRLADRIRLLQLSLQAYLDDVPQQAVMRIDLTHNQAGSPQVQQHFKHLLDMYQYWAKNRSIPFERFAESKAGTQQEILVFRGLAAWPLIAPEAGLHVWEYQEGKKKIKSALRVDVLPILPEHARYEDYPDWNSLFYQREASPQITRKYKLTAQKEVVDQVRSWRSSNWEAVFKGNFDLIE